MNDKNEVVLIELNLHSPGVYQLIGPALGNYTDEILEMVRQSKNKRDERVEKKIL